MRSFRFFSRSLVGVLLVLGGAASWGVVQTAAAAPVQWTGTASGTWVRLFVDGQKCAGGAEAALAAGPAKLELSGAGSGSRYSGTLTGSAWRGDAASPLTGTWQATLGGGGEQIRMTLRPKTGQPATVTVSLRQQQYRPLFCSWARGTVTRRPAEGAAAPLAKGGEIRVGDRIETGADGRAVVVLGDSSVVMLQESTRIEVPRVPENAERTQKVRAQGGKVWFAVKKVQQGSKFEVETDEAVAAVRGTEFLVEVGAEGEVSLTTAEGQVDVTDASPTRATTAVLPGMQWSFRRPRGEVQGAVGRRLLPRPVKPLLQSWAPLLQEADRSWPYRRLDKKGFWQDRLSKPDAVSTPGRSTGPRPRSERPHRAPRAPGPRAGAGLRRGAVQTSAAPPVSPARLRHGRRGYGQAGPMAGGPPPIPHPRRPPRAEVPPPN